MNYATLNQPTLQEMVGLDIPFQAKISPNGLLLAINVKTTNWKDNCYENLCHIHGTRDHSIHIVNHPGSVLQMEWVGERILALLIQDPKNAAPAQVWLYDVSTREARVVTDYGTGVDWFKPFADGFILLTRHPERIEKKARTGRFGAFIHYEKEESDSALYFIGLKNKRLTELSGLFGKPVPIREVLPSPSKDAIYLNCWQGDDWLPKKTSVFQIRLNLNTDRVGPVGIKRLNVPRGASLAAVSPDNRQLIVAYQERDDKVYTRRDLWLISLEDAEQAPDEKAFLKGMRNFTASLDRNIKQCVWAKTGIFGIYENGSANGMVHFSENGTVLPLDLSGVEPGFAPTYLHVCDAGYLGILGEDSKTFREAFFARPADEVSRYRLEKLSDFGKQVRDWDLGSLETIRWKNKDGVEIEGILRKPADFDSKMKYPLVFIVHGGPLACDMEYLLTVSNMRYYPAVQFVNKGMLVLQPNYRGSEGYGQAFADLLAGDLAINTLSDLEGAITHLDNLGYIDTGRIGCMGWSFGGYISAFVGLHSDKFKVVSVGAGVSDYYISFIGTSIPDEVKDYLLTSPFQDRAAYIKTAPISNLKNAKTPMLIQHGSDDPGVPFLCAMELFRGLKEMKVPVELFIYPGTGHYITKPRENHAVMHQNFNWFCHYLLGEELELE